ncbi:MAG: hypothetical protein V2A69_10215 [Pseudomonadota bacterium]
MTDNHDKHLRKLALIIVWAYLEKTVKGWERLAAAEMATDTNRGCKPLPQNGRNDDQGPKT